MAQVAVASDASSRSSVGAPARSTPSGRGQQPAEEPLAAGADHHRVARAPRARRGGAAGQVVGRGLAEPDARVDPDLARPRRRAPARPARPGSRLDLGDHVVVAGIDLHGVGRALHGAWPPSRRPARPATSCERGRHVVDQGGAGRDRGPGHRRLDACRSRPAPRRPAPRSPGRPGAAPRPRRPARRRAGSTRRRRRRRRRPRRPGSGPWAIATSGSRNRPPSENESGVTLSTPITSGITRREGTTSRQIEDRAAPVVAAGR